VDLGVTAYARILAAARDRPLAGFMPSDSFAPLLDRSNRLILCRAANRVGKSRHASWVAAREAIELPAEKGRPARIRIVGPNRSQVNGVIGRYLAEFLRGHLSERSYHNGRSWNSNTILLANGSTIQLKSMEDDPQTHAGDELDLVVIDEVPKRAHFSESLARIGSVRGRMIVVLTPVDRPCGWLREIVEADGSDWLQVVAPFSRETCPWYSQEQVDEHIANVKAAGAFQYAQRIAGEWDGITVDRMIDGFVDESVVTDDPGGTIDLGVSMDHGILAGKTIALLWAHRKTGQSVIVDEWIARSAHTPEQVAQEIDRMVARHGFTLDEVAWGVGDINVSGFTGASLNKELEAEFASIARRNRSPFRIRAPYKGRGSVHYGVRLLNVALKRGDLKVHARCTGLIEALKHWQGRKTGGDALLSDRIDAARYGAVMLHGQRKAYAGLRFT
jgi:phage terminase large subunit-like protein